MVVVFWSLPCLTERFGWAGVGVVVEVGLGCDNLSSSLITSSICISPFGTFNHTYPELSVARATLAPAAQLNSNQLQVVQCVISNYRNKFSFPAIFVSKGIFS